MESRAVIVGLIVGILPTVTMDEPFTKVLTKSTS